MKDVHRIDAARQAAVSQCAVMAEEIEQLNEDVKSLKASITTIGNVLPFFFIISS